jgi:hypothetical protein
MAGFLEQYETRSNWRENLVKWFFLLIVIGLLVWGIDWTLGKLGKENLSDFRAQWRVRSFISALEAQRYEDAYSMWGCDKAHPCRDYAYEKFMEDWGPHSPNSGAVKAKKLVVRHCESGIVRTDLLPNREMVHYYVNRDDLNISFAPWGDSCSAPSIPVP